MYRFAGKLKKNENDFYMSSKKKLQNKKPQTLPGKLDGKQAKEKKWRPSFVFAHSTTSHGAF